jgi:hypothetical protein
MKEKSCAIACLVKTYLVVTICRNWTSIDLVDQRWSTPPESWVKINVDAGFKLDSGEAAIGIWW